MTEHKNENLTADNFSWPVDAAYDNHHEWGYHPGAQNPPLLLILERLGPGERVYADIETPISDPAPDDRGEYIATISVEEAKRVLDETFVDATRDTLKHHIAQNDGDVLVWNAEDIVEVEPPLPDVVDPTLMQMDPPEFQELLEDVERALKLRAEDTPNTKAYNDYTNAAEEMGEVVEHCWKAMRALRAEREKPFPSEMQAVERLKEFGQLRDPADAVVATPVDAFDSPVPAPEIYECDGDDCETFLRVRHREEGRAREQGVFCPDCAEERGL